MEIKTKFNLGDLVTNGAGTITSTINCIEVQADDDISMGPYYVQYRLNDDSWYWEGALKYARKERLA